MRKSVGIMASPSASWLDQLIVACRHQAFQRFTAVGVEAGEARTITGVVSSLVAECEGADAMTGADMRTLAQSSAALLLADRTQLRLGPLSLLRLNPQPQGKTALELSVGRLWSRTKREPADLELRTPAAVAAVRGTDWDVEVGADGRTLLTVLSGQIDVSNPQGSVVVGAVGSVLAESLPPPHALKAAASATSASPA